MRDVVIKTGVYGHRTAKGRVQTIAKGETVSVSDEEAARLVSLDVAAYADDPTQTTDETTTPPSGGGELEGEHQDTPGSEPPAGATTPPPGGGELEGEHQGTPGTEPPAGADTEGEGGDTNAAEVKRLERMPKDDLVQMAQDMGVDISGAKNNHERAVLIVAAGASGDSDAPPVLGVGDIVQ